MQGETNFRAGRYAQAVSDFRHALVDDQQNGGLLMLMAQAMFQTGEYRQAAGAIEMGMGLLPEEKWGAVIENYTQLYGNVQDFTNQLKSLEAARAAKPDDPALRFLLGYNFGYLGYPQQAVSELNKAVELEGATRPPASCTTSSRRRSARRRWDRCPNRSNRPRRRRRRPSMPRAPPPRRRHSPAPCWANR